ncbi:MAG: HlyD family type I secretion periplasmic adaptor subunit [Rickettsiales bacterium]|nr:HlyD family type I secretion periplasmic adaptor subunit [Rickettsiales bacterium]
MSESVEHGITARANRFVARFIALADQLAERISPRVTAIDITPEALARPTILFGITAVAVIFGILVFWSAVAPLNSAAIAGGNVILDSNKKTIQHLEGGIVDQIYVREGEFVEKGQKLIRLDETSAKARYDLLKAQFISFKAAEARLLAERDNSPEIVFSKELLGLESSNNIVRENLDSQRRLFESRRRNVEGKISVLQQKIEQTKREIQGLNAQQASTSEQIRLLRDELAGVRTLYASNNISKQRLRALEREEANMSGESGEYIAMISRAEQSIAEADIQILNTRNDVQKEVVEELRETQTQLADLEERIRASADMFDRIVVSAPLAGTITDLRVHTVGGVITPGEKIADIIPQDDKLVIEAKVQPQDIDVVRTGLVARVRLSAYKTRKVPPVDGIVRYVSADRFTDERTGISYYLARIEIDEKELKALKEVELYPGMPAEVLIVTGERTLLAYLFSPITESFSKAFREQ